MEEMENGEELETLVRDFDRIYQGYNDALLEIQSLKMSCNCEVMKREALEATCDDFKAENEKLRSHHESWSKFVDEMAYRAKCQRLTGEIREANIKLLSLGAEHEKMIDMLKQEYNQKIHDLEKQVRMTIVKSLEQLFLLGALTDDYKLSSPVGHQMAKLPLDPMYSKALILAAEFKCLEEMLIVVAMLSVEAIFYFPREKLEEARAARKSFSSPEGDHISMLNVYRASAENLEKNKIANVKEKTLEKKLNKWCRENFINYRSLRHARDIHSQIEGHIQQMGFPASSCGDDTLQFRRCLTASFFLNAAMKQPDGSYRLTLFHPFAAAEL